MAYTTVFNLYNTEISYREKAVSDTIMVTLIIGKPGHIVNGLCSLLKAHPDLSVLSPENDLVTAYQQIHQSQPQLVVFDSTLPHEEVIDTLKQVKFNFPNIYCIVIVEKAQQYHAALSAGADGALFTGFPVEHLLRTVNKLQIGNFQDIEK